MSLLKRHAPALATVLLLHGGALWALQNGLLQRALAPITQPEMLVEIMTAEPAPDTPRATPQKPEKARTPEPIKALAVQPQKPQLQVKPEPLAVTPLPSPAPAAAPQTAPASPVPASASTVATASATQATGTANPPPAPALQLPSSDADYLNNPKPSYPAMSRRLGEQGTVVVHTLIGADGLAQKAEILRSSGFERLDRAALETALKWRYVPGKRAGVAEAMWFKVPLRFVLD